MRTLMVVAVTAALGGCATQAEKLAQANAHYTAQDTFAKTASAAQHPIFELEGIDGKEISLSGVKALRVYANQATPQFQAAPVAPEAFVETLKVAKELTLGLVPVALGVKALSTIGHMSDNIATGRGPVTTTTTTTSNANQANSANVSNANQSNTSNANVSNANQANTSNANVSNANVSTTSTLGNNSVLGSGTSSNPISTSTTTAPTTTSHGTCTTGSC